MSPPLPVDLDLERVHLLLKVPDGLLEPGNICVQHLHRSPGRHPTDDRRLDEPHEELVLRRRPACHQRYEWQMVQDGSDEIVIGVHCTTKLLDSVYPFGKHSRTKRPFCKFS